MCWRCRWLWRWWKCAVTLFQIVIIKQYSWYDCFESGRARAVEVAHLCIKSPWLWVINNGGKSLLCALHIRCVDDTVNGILAMVDTNDGDNDKKAHENVKPFSFQLKIVQTTSKIMLMIKMCKWFLSWIHFLVSWTKGLTRFSFQSSISTHLSCSLTPLSISLCRSHWFLLIEIKSSRGWRREKHSLTVFPSVCECVYVSGLCRRAVGNVYCIIFGVITTKNDLMRKHSDQYIERADFMGCKHNERSSARTKHIPKLHLFVHCPKVQNGQNNSDYIIRCHIYWFVVVVHIILCITNLTTKHSSTLTDKNMNLVVVVLFFGSFGFAHIMRSQREGEGEFF